MDHLEKAVEDGTSPGFRPSRLLRGGDLQTIGGQLLRSSLRWTRACEDVEVEVEQGVSVLIRASWQAQAQRPAALLIHGLEGSDDSVYMLSAGEHAYRAGYHVLRMNMRGCGDSLESYPRLYNAGMADDLVAVAQWLAQRVTRFGVIGFSLGANLTLLALGKRQARLPMALQACATVSPPLDLSECAEAIARPRNRFYQYRFVSQLKQAYRSRQRLEPGLYASGRERSVRTVRDYDDAITAHYAGYRDAEDYYQQSSAGPHLVNIERPTLIIAAEDDPLIPGETISKWRLSSAVQREMLSTGGHVGFVGDASAPGRFWAADRIVTFLEETIGSEKR